ncbi:hypothetical protein [Pedobacter frigoris]|uniref:hypothetical protein n=1 Tax=Pedobacter frigoris TaxID=2571272 RepID=UPI00292D7B17|nr:hypothetical protein [Pedobacter frigoris]
MNKLLRILGIRAATILLIVVGILMETSVFGQTVNSINITVNIVPPYSPYYSDYSGANAGKVLLIVQNQSAVQRTIKLTGQLQGDNGIKITTKSNYVPLKPIILSPNETKQLSGLALKDIFDLNTLNVYGVDKVKIVQTSRLPEGNYTFCIQAVDYNTNQLLSSNAPLGCTSLSITYPEAPVLIGPRINEEVRETNPQSMVFNWMNTGVVPMGTQYVLQLAEMPDVPSDPNQILNSASFPLINKNVNGFAYVLSPSDPPLKFGKLYAWRIKAVDPTGKTVFKNDGVSRASQFRYGSGKVSPIFALIKPKANDGVVTLDTLSFNWKILNKAQVSGNRKYELRVNRVKTKEEKDAEAKAAAISRKSRTRLAPVVIDNSVVVVTTNETVNYKTTPELVAYIKPGENYEWYVRDQETGAQSEIRNLTIIKDNDTKNFILAINGKIRYNYHSNYISAQSKVLAAGGKEPILTEAEKGFDLSNKSLQIIKVRLLAKMITDKDSLEVVENGKKVKHYNIKTVPQVINNLSAYPGAFNVNNAVVVGFATTDSLGNFTANVPINVSQYKVIDSAAYVMGTGNNKQTYAIVEGLVVKINDDHFTDPNWFIVPNQTMQKVVVKEETVKISSYKLNVRFTDKYQRNYKGKLYLLKPKEKLVIGEVDNLLGQVKKTTFVNPAMYNAVMNANRNMVGSRGVDLVGGSAKEFVFDNLVNENGSAENYVVYFEPDDSQNSLYFDLQRVGLNLPAKIGYTRTIFNNQNLQTSVDLGPKFLTMRISGRYVYEWKDKGKAAISQRLPLPEGTELVLMKGYISQKDLLKDGSVLNEEQFVEHAIVGKNGAFTFNIGVKDYNNFNNDSKQMVIIVRSPYFNSEPKSISYNQQEDVQVDELLATVKQFKLRTRVGYIQDNKIVGVKDLNVYLCRKKGAVLTPDFPTSDGDPQRKSYFKTVWENPKTKEQYEILDQAATTADGYVSFTRMIMPNLKGKDNEYFICAEPTSASQYNYITENPFPLSGNTRFFNLLQISNSERNYFSDNQITPNIEYVLPAAFVRVVPQRPIIDGAVYPYSNTSTSVLSGVNIKLYDMTGVNYSGTGFFSMLTYTSSIKSRVPEDSTINGSNGRFLFDTFKYGVTSGWKLLKLSKKGFISTYFPVNTGIPLKSGDRANLAKLFLELPNEFDATIENDIGEPVAARVIVGDDFSWSDSERIGARVTLNGLVGGYESVRLKTPNGEVKLTIIPKDKSVYKTTVVTLKDISKSTTSGGKLKVMRNMHSVVVTCIDHTGKKIAANVYLTNKYISATQRPMDLGFFGGKFTLLEFAAAGTEFDLQVIPVDNYTIAKTQVHSDMSGTVSVTVRVNPAGRVKASASTIAANGSKKTAGIFNVAVSNYNDDEYIVDKSGTGGYMISRLPLNDGGAGGLITVFSGGLTGYLGDTQWTQVVDQSTAYVNFNFKNLPSGIQENLYNFPVLISSYEPAGNGNYNITGRLNPKGNADKSNLTPANQSDWLTFYNVLIKPGQNGGPQTILSKVYFRENELKAVLHQNYNVSIIDNSGLSLDAENGGASLKGFVQLDPASLAQGLKTSVSNSQGDDNCLYLNKEETSYASNYSYGNNPITDYLRTFSTSASDILTKPLMVSNRQRRQLDFRVADDLQIVPQEKILFTDKGMKFKGIVNTKLDNISASKNNIKAAATFVIDNNGYSSIDEQPVNLLLNNWRLEFAKWKLNKTGLKASAGVLNAQGLTIPFENLTISYNKVGFGKFDVTKLKLLNSFDVTLNNSQTMTSFGFDKGYSKTKGAWSVSILANSNNTALASLKGLPDLEPTDEIKISNINLYDTGDPNDTRILLVQDQAPVTLNKIAKFTPGTVSGGVDYVSFKGALDLDVPNLSGLKTESYELVYKMLDGKFKHDTAGVFKNLKLDANGIVVTFSDQGQRFSNNTLVLKGTLRDKDKPDAYSINVELNKTKDNTRLFVPVAPGTNQIVYLNSKSKDSYLNKVTGEMVVTGQTWNNFAFEGDLVTPKGISEKDSHLKFIVKGDLVADQSKIGVQNMGAGGVSGLNLTYDFKESALVGSCHLSQSTDFADLETDIEMYIGGSKWYIFTNGIARNITGAPIKEAGIGMMVGNAQLTAEQKASLKTHFKNDVPASFEQIINEVSGVLLITSIDVPIPILPTFDIDLDPVAHCELKHGIYGNFFFESVFSTKPEELSLTIGGRLGGYVKVGAGASIGLACASVSLHADIHADVNGTLTPLAKSGPKIQLGLALTFTLEGEAYVGAGICNSRCETPCVDLFIGTICSPIPCVKVGIKEGITVGVEAEMTEKSISLKSK